MSAISVSRREAQTLLDASSPGLVQTILAYAHRRLDAHKAKREVRRAHRQIMAMTDYQLKDIGVSRGEINARVFGPASRAGSIID